MQIAMNSCTNRIPGPADIPCVLPAGHEGFCRPDYDHKTRKLTMANGDKPPGKDDPPQPDQKPEPKEQPSEPEKKPA